MHEFITGASQLGYSRPIVPFFDPDAIVVTADQMRTIEARVFAGGMPVAALMEKVAGRIVNWIRTYFPLEAASDRDQNHQGLGYWPRLIGPAPLVGILAGSGHNGGDALVVARELHFRGYRVRVCQPVERPKALTASHARYAQSLGIPIVKDLEPLLDCDLWVDGLFGFGLSRPVEGDLAEIINQVNQSPQPVVSVDLPSGLHTNTGRALGAAIRADHTLCLGLWKMGLLQDHALAYTGTVTRLDFDLPAFDIQLGLGESPRCHRITRNWAIAQLPLPRPVTTHKYRLGHLLLVCGSRRYAGAALLTGLGARASGVGMLSIAVPESLRDLIRARIPDALVVGCPETDQGTIAADTETFQALLTQPYDAVGCGPGLTTGARSVVQTILATDWPLVLDADGLNILAEVGTQTLKARSATTILTPHLGEFQRLFPDFAACEICRISAARQAAQATSAILLLKGARVTIADPQGSVWINPESTPALARGGSGDVLTGLMSGLLAQKFAALGDQFAIPAAEVAAVATWWHAQAGLAAARARTELGVDAETLSQWLIPVLADLTS